ncbi:ABC transporter ATP-binding protein [Clostridiaceae bacterium HSG29]|nr:ABC transporter ATP-binding protein [Clostridiaceae bacterium HSG29]
MIKISDLNFTYNKNENRIILKNIDVEFKRNEISVITGLSGCGKSTLFRIISKEIISNDINLLTGNIFINGENLNNIEKKEVFTKLAIVRQDPDTQLIFPLVIDELAFGLENLNIKKDEILEKIDQISKELSIEHLLFQNPRFLSGGEKQIVVLASVLLLGANILLLDECMSQVDKKGRERIFQILKILKNEGKTIIMVEHNLKNLVIADKTFSLINGNLSYFKGYNNEEVS